MRPGLGRGLGAALLLGLVALAGWPFRACAAPYTMQPPELVKVMMHTDPEGAEVYFLTSGGPFGPVGYTGQPFDLDIAQYQRQVEILFRLKGYREKKVSIPNLCFQLRKSPRWPEQGTERLDPLYPVVVDLYYAIVRHPVATAVVVFGMVGAIWMGVLPRVRRAHLQQRELEVLKEFASQADLTDPLVRDQVVIGHYKIVDKVGEGGTSSVYKAVPAHDVSSSEVWALKILNQQLADDPEFRLRFEREILVCRMMDHRNIVRTKEDGEHQGMLYIVMEFVEGTTLKARVQPGGLPPRQALDLLKPVFEAIWFAHSRGVIHRDIKPSNVMVTGNGVVKVMDFGLARKDDLQRVTRSGNVMGTASYIAPEQLRNQPLTPAQDQYSLGVMAYELLTGRCPFVGDDDLAVAMQHVTERPPEPRRLRPDLPRAVDIVLLRMLEKDPERRYASVMDAYEALEKAITGRG